jgi:hypothetical protein
MTGTATATRIQLKNAGEQVTIAVESAEQVPVGTYPEYAFIGGSELGVVDLRVPKKSDLPPIYKEAGIILTPGSCCRCGSDPLYPGQSQWALAMSDWMETHGYRTNNRDGSPSSWEYQGPRCRCGITDGPPTQCGYCGTVMAGRVSSVELSDDARMEAAKQKAIQATRSQIAAAKKPKKPLTEAQQQFVARKRAERRQEKAFQRAAKRADNDGMETAPRSLTDDSPDGLSW